MEKTMDFAELEELKAQFNILNEKLEKQTIINETLIKESMKQKLSYVDRIYRVSRCSGLMAVLIMLVFLLLFKAPLAWWILTFVTMILESYFSRRAFRKLDTKNLITLRHVDAVEKVAIFKKSHKRISYVLIMPAIIAVILYIGFVTNYKFDIGTVLYYVVIFSIIIVHQTVRERRMFKNLDAVLKQIEELRSEG